MTTAERIPIPVIIRITKTHNTALDGRLGVAYERGADFVRAAIQSGSQDVAGRKQYKFRVGSIVPLSHMEVLLPPYVDVAYLNVYYQALTLPTVSQALGRKVRRPGKPMPPLIDEASDGGVGQSGDPGLESLNRTDTSVISRKTARLRPVTAGSVIQPDLSTRATASIPPLTPFDVGDDTDLASTDTWSSRESLTRMIPIPKRAMPPLIDTSTNGAAPSLNTTLVAAAGMPPLSGPFDAEIGATNASASSTGPVRAGGTIHVAPSIISSSMPAGTGPVRAGGALRIGQALVPTSALSVSSDIGSETPTDPNVLLGKDAFL